MKFAVLLIALMLTACASAPERKLTVGIMPDLDSVPFVIAKEQGYLPDYVTLEIFRSPVDRDSALFSGALDGTISDMLAVALAQNGGFEAFATSKTNGRYALLAGSASGVTSASQLDGLEVGMSLNTIIEYVTDRIITASGGDPDGISKVSVPKIPSRIELLEQNQITAVSVPEPYVTAAAADGAVILNTSSELGVNPAVMLFTREAVDKKSRELLELYDAYDKAVDYISSTDKSEFMPRIVEYLGLPASAVNVELPVYEKTAPPEAGEVESAVEWLLAKSLIERKLEYSELVKEIR